MSLNSRVVVIVKREIIFSLVRQERDGNVLVRPRSVWSKVSKKIRTLTGVEWAKKNEMVGSYAEVATDLFSSSTGSFHQLNSEQSIVIPIHRIK